ncbi:hypothetical protein P7K49_040765 [Saguinus oedipus]|uniref:Uncharacterized protein n=1 Tax=Saguinus oedipus TaxID=9490 RepID=A0ABQ9TCW6_SAGOE|nr:hypothetical protein P7K49_040765 [Saguinus oedipus]
MGGRRGWAGWHQEGQKLLLCKEAEDLHRPPGSGSLLFCAQEAELLSSPGLEVGGSFLEPFSWSQTTL